MDTTKTYWLVTIAVFLATALTSVPVGAVPVTIGNSSFEAPDLSAAFAYTPSGATWSFTGNAGISAPPSGFGSTPAPDGDQYAFLQTISSFSQPITFPVDGNYVLTFFAAGRPPGGGFGGTQTYQALLDLDVIFPATTTANGGPFTFEQSEAFFATAGVHTLTFQGVNSNNDNTAFIDAIAINGAAVTAAVPGPASILLLCVGAAGLPAIRRLLARTSLA